MKHRIATLALAAVFTVIPFVQAQAQVLASAEDVVAITEVRPAEAMTIDWYTGAADRMLASMTDGRRDVLNEYVAKHYDDRAADDLGRYFDELGSAYGALESFQVMGSRTHPNRLGKVETFVLSTFEKESVMMRLVWSGDLLVTVTHQAQ